MDGFDVVVIGSGFGGAVAGCRLAEQGYRVLILERGRRWEPRDYPRSPDDPWVWDQYNPHRRNGWLDMRLFHGMAVLQGAGVGGGSLLYANISIEATRERFENGGWPEEINRDELDPYYYSVGAMLDVQQVPDNQLPPRTRLVRQAAEAVGDGDRFLKLPLAVSFDKERSSDFAREPDSTATETFENQFGVTQGRCVHLGNCVVGCDVNARNTLAVNYIPLAQRHGAEVRPLHVVRAIEPDGEGYRVWFDRIENGHLVEGRERARIVIVAAGSLGSTELLLRSRDQYRTLPQVSGTLGRNWSANGDFVTPAFYKRGLAIEPTRGPTITSAIDYRDGGRDGQRMLIEDGGFPNLVGNWLEEMGRSRRWRWLARGPRRALASIGRRDPVGSVMPWFAQCIDASDGRMHLAKRWRFFGERRLWVDWDAKGSRAAIDAVAARHAELARATGGDPVVPPTWRKGKFLVTPHPLGGCSVGADASKGVVSHMGEVFGHRNLFVADGAVVPSALGANPSRTIAALAERTATLISKDGR